jgi:hypothetical protein
VHHRGVFFLTVGSWRPAAYRQGELAAFLVELVVQKRLVTPKETGDSSAPGLVYEFLHGEEAM